MKRLYNFLLMLLALLLPATAHAQTFEVDGIQYEVNGDGVTVTYNMNTGFVTIPETVSYYGTTYSVTAIGNSAFYYSRNGLTGVSIPNTVVTIGDYAFRQCSGMTEISIGNSVTTIGRQAFYQCSGLTSITLPNSVTTIGMGAFYQCTGLTEIFLGNSVTTIDRYAFYYCSGLTSITIPGSVTSIGSSAFIMCTGLTSVNITDIAAWCNIFFDGPSANPLSYANHLYLNGALVTEVIIPNTITAIGNYTFYGCTDLTNVTIPNTVTIIDRYAFGGCSGLTSLSIPSSVTTIGDYAFSGCGGLNSITVASANPNYDSRNNCNAIIETATNTLIVGCNNTVIPNTVTAIGNEAFYGCMGLASVDIPNSVTTIGSGAFYNCTNLSDIKYLDLSSVTTIGMFAFENTAWLNNQPDGEIVYIGTVAYRYKGTMPEGTSLTIRDGTLSIADGAFYFYENCPGLKSITIPNSVITIGNHAFAQCNGLLSIDIPSSVTTIGGDAFMYCTSLTSVSIPNSVTTLGNEAFAGCSSLTSVELPNSISAINNYLFYGCSSLTNVTIPNTITSIGDNAFYNCSSLSSIAIPNSVTSIGNYAFYESGLTSVNIPHNVTSIGRYAFSYCSALTSVSIPGSVTAIGDGAFYRCPALNTVYCRSLDPYTISMGSNVFALYEEDYSGRTLYVPLGKRNKYYSDSNWSQFFFWIQEKQYVDFVVDGLCYRFNGDGVAVTSPEDNSVQYTGDITIPATVTYDGMTYSVNAIDEKAFYGCSGVTNVDIPNSVITIGNYAFDGCSGLTHVIIPASVTSVGGYDLWDNCYAIESVTCKATTPPTCDSYSDMGIFEDIVRNHAPLYVPKASVKDYKADPEWGRFLTIIGIDMVDGVPATSIKLNRAQMSLLVDDSSQLYATVLPDSTTNKRVAWVSSNGSVASVDSTGMVTAHAPGATIISAMTTDGTNLSAQCVVTVHEEIGDYDNYLMMGDTIVFHGKTVVLPVKMTNATNIIAFQTDLTLPDGLELLQDDDEEYLVEPSSRMTSSHSIMSSKLANGNIRVSCYSSNLKAFTGNSGDDLFYLTVKVADDAQGDYMIKMSNSLLTTKSYEEIAAPDITANVHVNACVAGDANDNGTVTVVDVVVTSLYVLERDPQPFNFEAADMNFDGFITVTDVSLIADRVLNPAKNAPRRAPAIWNNGDRMSGNDITLAAGETRRVSIVLDNAIDYSAFQLDVKLPDGLTASNFAVTDRASGHAFDVNTLKNGNIRALCYSPTIEAIDGHEGTLLTFDVTAVGLVKGEIIVDGIELVTNTCQTVRLDAFSIGVNSATSVNELNGSKTVSRIDYYNLAGQQISSPENGVTLVVTTYTDGTRTTTKVIK